MVIACSDSRVAPERIFGAAPGELFVVRNVAGLVPPYELDGGHHGTSAALEYAVRVLKVARVVVLGHAQCGGIRVMLEGAPKEARDFVEPWMQARGAGADRAAGRSLRRGGAAPLRGGGGEAVARQSPDLSRGSRGGRMPGGWSCIGFRFGIRSGVLTTARGRPVRAGGVRGRYCATSGRVIIRLLPASEGCAGASEPPPGLDLPGRRDAVRSEALGKRPPRRFDLPRTVFGRSSARRRAEPEVPRRTGRVGMRSRRGRRFPLHHRTPPDGAPRERDDRDIFL